MGEYQEMLAGLGDKWKQQDESVSSLAATMVMVTAALETQRELLAEQAAETKALQDAEKEKAKAESEQERREKEAERRRHKAVEDTVRIAKSIKDATLDLAKWTFLGGAAGLIGGAATGWGLDRAANWVGDQRRAAMGYGVSIAERQALTARFGRDFSPDAVLEGLANAQMDPSKAYVFAGLGINPNGKNPAELAIDAAIATRQRLQGVPQQSQLALAGALGIDQIFSPDAIRTIMGEPAGDLERRRGQYQSDTAVGGKLYLASQAAEKWQDLTAELQIKVLSVLDPLVTKLSDPKIQDALNSIIDQFGALATQVLDRIDFDALGKGLQTFSDTIASGEFQKDFKQFIDGLSLVTDEIMAVAEKLKWILPNDKNASNQVGPHGELPPGAPPPDFGAHNQFGQWELGGPAWDRHFVWHPNVAGAMLQAGAAFAASGLAAGGHDTPAAIQPGAVAGGPRNNLLNLTDPRTGQIRHFDSVGASAAAAEQQLLRDYHRYGLNTIAGLIDDPRHGWANEWAPGNSRETASNYISRVAGSLGIGARQTFNMDDPQFRQRLMSAMAEVEQGSGSGRKHRSVPAAKLHITVQTGIGQSTAAVVNQMAPAS